MADVEVKGIELVMSQANVAESKRCPKALKNNSHDIVYANMNNNKQLERGPSFGISKEYCSWA